MADPNQPTESHEPKQLSDKDRQLIYDRINKTSKGVLGYFVNRRRVAILVIGIILLAGLFAAISLPREANPEVKVPIAVVVTVWPGASPADIESLITDKIENQIENLENLKLLTSSSSNSVSSIVVEFEADADLDDSIRKLRDEVQNVSGLPDEAEDPEIIEVSFDDVAIVTFSLVGDLTDRQLKLLGKQVQDELESINGVSRVELIGVRQREIVVVLNPGELNRLRITTSTIIRAIASANLNLPLGDIDSGGLTYNLRSVGEISQAEDLGNIVVANTAGGAVLLKDIAQISDQLTEKRSISRIAIGTAPALNTVSLQVFKSTGGNIIDIVDEAKAKIQGLKDEQAIPAGVDINITNDNSQFVRDDFNTLGRSGVQTLILIFITLALALSLRFAAIALMSIPLIFLMGLWIISLQGSTLNSLTLFSLVLSLGLLIDTTIILLEGVWEALRLGFNARESALYAIATYKWPITAGVLTTIAAFVPMFLVGGIVGEFLKTLPLTIAAVLGSSLFIGLVIMPPLAALMLRGALERGKPHRNLFQRRVITPLASRYRVAIREFLGSKKKRRRVSWVVTLLFLFSFGMIATGVLKTELFPQVDIDFMLVNIEMPKGTILEETDAKTREVEVIIKDIPEMKNYVANVGSSGEFGIFTGGSSSSNLANITINLVDDKFRDLKSFDIAALWRERLAAVAGAKVTIEEISGGPPTGEPIELQILGDDFTQLSQAANDIKALLADIAGVFDISSSDNPSPPEFTFKLDHEKLGRQSLSGLEVSSVLRSAIFGAIASDVTLDDEDIDIIVKYGDGLISRINDIENLEITNARGENIKITQVAEVRLEPALQTIRHRDTQRVVSVSAKNQDRSVREINAELTTKLAALELPPGIRLIQGGEFEDEAQAFVDLYKAMSVAVLLIFFIMVLQFDSYKQPFAILLTLPLAFIGVILGTLLFGLPFGFSTFLGIVALGGIVVNDAIVLIDRINYNLRIRKLQFEEAIAEGGEARLQPIILTTVTTILGVTPLAFADEFWRGLSIAIASGMLFATFLTLFIIPILYQRFEKKRWLKEHSEVANKVSQVD